jgi:acyl-CoA reductase-like NAD-dependent aldehyde dehydrogenase
MGKAIKESRSEVERCASTIEHFADHGKIFANDQVVNTDARKSTMTFQPLGVIGSVMPWNFPYWPGSRFAAPSLLAGNAIVLKPASTTMQCGIEIEKTFDKAGVPRSQIKKTVLELGGSDPFIVCEDEGIEKPSTVNIYCEHQLCNEIHQ